MVDYGDEVWMVCWGMGAPALKEVLLQTLEILGLEKMILATELFCARIQLSGSLQIAE